MENKEVQDQGGYMKHIILMLLVLGVLVVSSVNLAFTLSEDSGDSNASGIEENLAAIEVQNDSLQAMLDENNEVTEPEFDSILFEKEYYNLPFGAAEIEVYYTTVEKLTSFDNSTPPETCSALVVTDGPELLMDALSDDRFGTSPTIVIGSGDSDWGGISDSTESNPIKVLVTMNSLFEGGVIGCMSWVFDSVIEIE